MTFKLSHRVTTHQKWSKYVYKQKHVLYILEFTFYKLIFLSTEITCHLASTFNSNRSKLFFLFFFLVCLCVYTPEEHSKVFVTPISLIVCLRNLSLKKRSSTCWSYTLISLVQASHEAHQEVLPIGRQESNLTFRSAKASEDSVDFQGICIWAYPGVQSTLLNSWVMPPKASHIKLKTSKCIQI